MVEVNLNDFNAVLEELKKLASSGVGLDLLEQYLKRAADQFKLSREETDNLRKSLVGIQSSIGDIKSIDWGGELEKWGENLSFIKQAIQETIPGIGTLAAEAALLSPQLINRTEIPKAFEVIGDAAESTSSKINESFMSMIRLMDPDLAKTKTAQYLSSLSSYADASKRFEMGLLMTAAASGQLSSVIGETGQNIDNLTLRSEAFSDMTVKIGNASGLSAAQVARYAKELMTIPGVLVDTDKPGNIAGQTIHYLDAAMKTATGTGQTFQQIMEDLTFAYETMGVKGQPALEFSARMQHASEALGLPLKFIKQYTEEASSAFNMFSNDLDSAANMSQSAINIMTRLGPALQQSGLGPKAINDVVKGVIDGISRMDTAQKAFLSAQTGGPGGLQGAFQIDQMIAEGKIDQVFDKVRQNMIQKLGAPIVTRAEAATSPEAAAQFQKQIMFMMSPAMGGIARDQASAVKLLEAMVSGKAALPQETKDGEKSLKDALERGTRLQDRGNNILVRIANASERMAAMQALVGFEKSRQIGGIENEEFNRTLMDLKARAAGAATLNPLTGEGLEGGRTIKEVIDNTFESPGEDLKGAIESAFGYVSSIGKTLSDEIRRNVNPVPGMPGIDASSLRTPTQLTANILDRQERIVNEDKVRESSQMVNVAVSTVCASCQRKVAAEEANKAISHHHDMTVRQDFLGNP